MPYLEKLFSGRKNGSSSIVTAESLDDSDENLQALCCADHASKTSAENSSRGKRAAKPKE